MWFLTAFVTVQLSTWTCHCVYLHHVWLYAEIWAFFVRTVTDVLVLDGVTYADFLSVQFYQFRGDGVYKTFEDWCFLAVWLMHAGREDTSIVQLLSDIAGPAALAVEVGTEPRRKQHSLL